MTDPSSPFYTCAGGVLILTSLLFFSISSLSNHTDYEL